MKFFEFFRKKRKPDVEVAKNRVGLCLGGGGARGFAHIGAIKAFEEAGLSFDLVVGTSAGSVVGALYAAGISAKEMLGYGGALNLKEVHNGIIFMPNDAGKIGAVVTKLLGNAKIEDLKRQYAAVAVDLVEGKQAIIDTGLVSTAVSASSAAPLFFKPVTRGKQHLVDGGLLNNIPSDVCRMLGATHVVTVDINPTRGGGTEETGIIDVLRASFSIMNANASVQGLVGSDVIIAPDMSKFRATSKEGWEEMVELGYEAGKAKINEIKMLF